MIYFDAAANAPVSKKALEAFVDVCKMAGNPNSAHTDGRHNAKLLDLSRRSIACDLRCEPFQIIFTSGATEAVNIANRSMLDRGTLKVCEHGHKCDTVFSDSKSGEFAENISHIFANNETGEIYDVSGLHEQYRLVGMDATAAVGHIPINFAGLKVNYLSFGGHKFGAPCGIGALITNRYDISPLIIGGGNSQDGRRAGTEPVALAVSMAVALHEKCEHIDQYAMQQCKMRDYLASEIAKISGAHINSKITLGDYTKSLPNIINFRIDGITGQSLVAIMSEKYKVMLSAGSACSAGTQKPSKTLLADGLSEEEALQSVRISLSEQNTMHQCEQFIKYLHEAAEIMR